jgi:hypothetical protein
VVTDPKPASRQVPTSVQRSCRLVIISMFLGLLTLVPSISAMPPDARSAAAIGIVLVAAAIFAGLTVWLTVKVYRGRNWARWSMLLFLGSTWLAGAMQFSDQFTESPVVGTIELIANAIEMFACWLLFFEADARRFFAKAHAAGPAQ